MDTVAWISRRQKADEDDDETVSDRCFLCRHTKRRFHNLDCGCLCFVWSFLLFFVNAFSSIPVWLTVDRRETLTSEPISELIEYPISTDVTRAVSWGILGMFAFNGMLSFSLLVLGLRSECYKSRSEYKKALLLTGGLVLLMVAATVSVIGVVIWGASQRSGLGSMQSSMKMALKSKAPKAWHELQTSAHCCGVDSYQDWSGLYPYSVPDSCCRDTKQRSTFSKYCSVEETPQNKSIRGKLRKVRELNLLTSVNMTSNLTSTCLIYLDAGFTSGCGIMVDNHTDWIYQRGCYDLVSQNVAKSLASYLSMISGPLIGLLALAVLELISVWCWFRSNIPLY